MDANVNAFVSAVKIFYENYAAGFVSPLQACYDEATSLYTGLPLVNAYKPAEEATEAYAKALEDYKNIATDLETLTNVSAAKRFVRIVGMLCDAIESEGGLLADSKYERMWASAFETWKLSKYDPTVEGVEDAIERFIAEGGPHEFFWSRLQQEHIDLLTAKLACFDDPEATYIDKASACKYVQFYVEQNAMFIDENNTEVLALVEMADDYRKSLPSLESEYREFLLANTEKFMAAVEEMESLKDYASIKAKVEAAKEFYYAMEIVGGEGGDTMRYILKYEALEDWLKDVEADCDVYIEVANKLESITDDGQLYLELVRGYACKDMLDDSYEGIVDAKAKYEAVCESVDEESSAINEEAYQTVDAMCAVRAGVFSEILDFLRNLFN
jgi:hypothetical protein